MKLHEIEDQKAFEAAFYGKHGILPVDALRRQGIAEKASETCARCSEYPADPALLGKPGEGHICGRCWQIDRDAEGDQPLMPWEM